MNNRDFDSFEKVEFNFDQEWVPKKAQKLRPHLYKDGFAYCCVFGPDPQVGIYGCGDSPEEAIMDWADDLDQRIAALTGEDNAAHIAIEHLER
ncbi:hypothetical protein ACHMWN_14785 [Pedobacter sp. UC225_61]|uniref:hypothetical protein n=1 Tax=Pedobacter sp. UC225_61 TaxID=3374623 RepID=UPI0037936976